MNHSSKPYFENLDGLRFISFFVVFLTHLFSTCYMLFDQSELKIMHQLKLFSLAELGVNFFFVLSGFLITYLLLTELKMHQKIHIKFFYIRRILRIWPLYYFILIFGFFIFPILKAKLGLPVNDLSSPFPCFIFLNNFHKIAHPNAGLIINILWSVGIEEQFYLCWPWLFYCIKQKYLGYFISAIIIFSLLFRAFYIHIVDIDYHTFGVLLELAIGGLIAYYIDLYVELKTFFKNLSKISILFFYSIFLLIVFYHQTIFISNFLYVIKPFIFSLLFGFVILEQNYSTKSIFKFSNFKFISQLGKYTYGMYCLHPIAILLCFTLIKKIHLELNGIQQFTIVSIVSFFITILISWFSYQYFESQFLKLKQRIS
jgi:peptidoglycan/LPS O-acetylase OafA/YrhL